MNKPWKKVREIMQRRGMRTADLARAAGISVGTLRNVGSGSSSSRRARQKITNLLATEFWPDIHISGHLIRMPAGAEIECASTEEAIQVARQFSSNVTVSGRAIYFVIPTRIVVQWAAELEPDGLRATQDFAPRAPTRNQPYARGPHNKIR